MKSLLCTFLAFALVSCHNPDEELPVVKSIVLNGQDSEFHGLAGNIHEISVTASDNEELSQMKISVVPNPSSHGHADEPISAFISPNIGNWDTLSISSIGGQEASSRAYFLAPDGIAGMWSVVAQVLDANGNLIQEKMDLHIQNDLFPAIQIQSSIPAAVENGILNLPLNGTLIIDGVIVDLDGLDSIAFSVTGPSLTTPFLYSVSPVSNWNYDLSGLSMPAFSATGNYYLKIFAVDLTGREYWKTSKVVVE
jgi:hypothetical protein